MCLNLAGPIDLQHLILQRDIQVPPKIGKSLPSKSVSHMDKLSDPF